VNPRTGAIKLNHPDLEADEIEHSCSLDVADRGPHTHAQVGRLLNLTRAGAQKIERLSLQKLHTNARLEERTP